ncbi:MAG TPA: stage V sporulation protein D, partial [Clostridiaceae bacterium]|nr:stage V sporulation protein D [Clostridiaceae bacterium]
MFALIVRLGWIQLVRGRELYNLANEQWTNDVKIDAKRGKILDRNGAELAVSASCERVDVFMKDVLNAEKENKDIKQQIASKLSEILGDKEEDLLKLLNKKLSNGNPINSVTIKRRIDDSQAKKIRELDLPGIVISDDSKRYYPNGNLLSQVLGFTNIDGDGQEGVELKYDKELKGTPGRIIMEADLYRRQLPYNISKYIDPIDGKDIQLTIDESVQLYVEKAIEDALVVNKAKAVTAIVMDPSTGDILAMASKPDFNPNDPRNMGNLTDFKEVQKLWNNRAVTFTYEPGSIFKVVTATAALSEGKVSDNDRFVCNGSKTVAGTTMHCWKYGGHGVQTFAQIIQNSCNVGFMILGERLGKDLLYKYIDAYGFGAKTGIDVNFEETGIKMPIKKVGPVELA